MICPTCGIKNSDESVRCADCGTSLHAAGPGNIAEDDIELERSRTFFDR